MSNRVATLVAATFAVLAGVAADGVEWLVVKPVANPGSLADLEASMKYLKGLL